MIYITNIFLKRLRSPIISNVISRTKYKLPGISDYENNGFQLPGSEKLNKMRPINFVIDNRHVIGLKFVDRNLIWTDAELDLLLHHINDEASRVNN